MGPKLGFSKLVVITTRAKLKSFYKSGWYKLEAVPEMVSWWGRNGGKLKVVLGC